MPILIQDNYHKRETLYAGFYHLKNAPWWLPHGIFAENVIAAYQFKGALSEADALLNKNNPAVNPLVKNGSPVWNSAAGVTIPAGQTHGFGCTAISSFNSCFIRFSGRSPNSICHLVAGGKFHVIGAGMDINNNWNSTNLAVSDGSSDVREWAGHSRETNGVIGANFVINDRELFFNGVKITTSKVGSPGIGYPFYRLIGNNGGSNNYSNSNVEIQAVVFYNTGLTLEQAAELTNSMNTYF